MLSQATDNSPSAAALAGDLRPGGFDGELRVSFVDGAGCWGSLILVRDWGRADFDPETMRAIQRLAGALVGGLRRTVVAQRASVEQPVQGPGLVVLDRHG